MDKEANRLYVSTQKLGERSSSVYKKLIGWECIENRMVFWVATTSTRNGMRALDSQIKLRAKQGVREPGMLPGASKDMGILMELWEGYTCANNADFLRSFFSHMGSHNFGQSASKMRTVDVPTTSGDDRPLYWAQLMGHYADKGTKSAMLFDVLWKQYAQDGVTLVQEYVAVEFLNVLAVHPVALVEYVGRNSPELILPVGLDVDELNVALRDHYGWTGGFYGPNAHLMEQVTLSDSEEELQDDGGTVWDLPPQGPAPEARVLA